MPFGTITSTESTFGSISGTIAGAVPGTLSGSVGVPGPVGPVGPVGPQGPQGIPGVGGAWGSIVGTLSAQGDLWTALSSKYDASNPNGFITSTALVPYITSATAASTYQPLSGMTAYLTTASAASTYAPIAAGLPTGGTVGQVLVKNSGTAYDATFQTLIPGDRYVTTSTSSLTVSNGIKNLTIGTGLAYTPNQDVTISLTSDPTLHHMHGQVTAYNSGTGAMTVDVQNHTGSGTYSAWTVNVGGIVPLQTVEWGEVLGNLGDQTDLATALGNKLETSDAASTYQTIAGMSSYLTTADAATTYYLNTNPDAFITASALTGYATESFVTSQGYITSAALSGYATESWVTSQGYLTSAPVTSVAGKTGAVSLVVGDVSGAAALSGATFTGLVNTVASTTTTAGLNIPHGAAPTTPVNGDVWTTTGGIFWRQNGSTQQAVDIGSTQTISGNKTFSNANVSLGTSTAAGTINVGSGATISGSTKAINIGTAGVSGSTTNITLGSAVSGALGTTTVNGNITVTGTTLTLGNSTAASTINVGTGATLSGSTKTINIGTNGVLGSTNVINIGPTATSGNINFNNNSVALGSNSTATTAAADTNSTALATTAFVVGQAGSATPLVNGTAAVGTSLRYARQDHVHPTDTSRAALASPTFTGTPAAPTAAVDTNTTQIATTAYVVGQGYLKSATASSTYAPLASPALTGTPTAPTAAAATNTTQIATTAFVQQEVPAASTTAAGKVELATRVEAVEATTNTVAVTPLQAVDMLMHPGYVQIAQNNSQVTTFTSGAGAGLFTTSMTRVCLGPNTATAGSVYYRPQTNGGVAQLWSRGNSTAQINFSKKVWMSGRSTFDSTHIGDANNTARVTIGKSGVGAGALAQKGIGWQKAGGSTANFFLLAHNGTTLTSIDTNTSLSSLGISGGATFDWSIYSDGTGNVTMWINDTQVATTSAGPTGLSLGNCVWQEEVDQTASAATRMYLTVYGGHYYHV